MYFLGFLWFSKPSELLKPYDSPFSRIGAKPMDISLIPSLVSSIELSDAESEYYVELISSILVFD